MLSLPTEEASYWQSSATKPNFPKLTEDLEVDVAIAGGGIAGMTIAYVLKHSGLRVAVLEKNTVGSGTTSKTTGKLTSQHNLIYADMDKRLGRKTARVYGDANQTAVEDIIKLIAKEKIDCDLERDDNYVYTTDPAKVARFKGEAVLTEQIGLPASFETTSQLPFEIQGAVKFSNQAKLNAQKYVLALAALVDGNGSYVFERSNVTRFHDGQNPYLKTNAAKIGAKHIVVTTKVPAAPLVARAACALYEHPHTSYIVASKFTGGLSGMYISPDKDHYSILPVGKAEEQLLLIGGENHTPGLGIAKRRYRRLANYTDKYFKVSSIDYMWKGMDYLSYDSVPLIGKLYPWSKHMYVATGFMKWGLSTSMVAALILRDSLHGQRNPWSEVFDSTRIKPITSIPRAFIKELKP